MTYNWQADEKNRVTIPKARKADIKCQDLLSWACFLCNRNVVIGTKTDL